MRTFWQDARYGIRLLTRNTGFSAVAVLTLALGIGANTAVFSVINGILLHPLPYERPDRLMFLTEWSEQVPDMSFSVANFKDVQEQSKTFESFVAFNAANFTLTGDGEAERVNGRNVSSGIFQTLRVRPILGRAFRPEEDKPGAERVVMLGEGFWTRRYGRRMDVIGKHLTLNDESYTVIGVLTGKMHGSWQRTDLFTPLLRLEDRIGGVENRGNHFGIYLIGRLKPGVTLEQGRGEIVAIARGLSEKYPDTNARQSMTVNSLHEAIVGDFRPALIVLLGAVAFVLLIACVNVANLLLGRAAARQRELAVRAALGAGRGRMIRQLLTESVVLSLFGGGLGLLLAYWGVAGIVAWIPSSIPRLEEVGVDGRVLLFTAAISVLTGLFFGLLPAWNASRTSPHEILKAGGRTGNLGLGHRRLRSALVVAEISLALILLVGAGLMLRSFYHVLHADAGIEPEGVIVSQVSLPEANYTDKDRIRRFTDQVLRNVEAIPGVQFAASTLPLLGGYQTSFMIEGRPEPPRGQRPSVDITRVSPAYFRAMGVRLLKGRAFTHQDDAGAPRVCIVDETLARTYWPGEDPLGRKVRIGGRPQDKDSVALDVVGVVGHVKNYGVDQPSRIEIYVPYTQDPISSFGLVVKTGLAPASLTTAMRKAVSDVDPNVPVFATQTLVSLVNEGTAQRRLAVTLLGVFAGLALLLAAVGIYGVISYNVSQRTQEIGIRMALGAERREILKMVLGQGTMMALLGVVIGLGVAFGLTRLIATMLFQVSATDPPTFSLVPVLLLLVAVLAAYLPARHAARVEPMVALRDE
ncbi:MAG TPA: ABC transporter permease [Candidatus Polarisedimenticolia bacterium]|jgi:putative ABC transport system permease protein|nr:ABC transporter permease [Candidatus Polarisedimenticolia bacterium]